ncbi:hypothetical protein A2630_01965 [Candidatus Woesebacteria bacterium RIFCSPHIGHO2_01_FULL_44_10]|uniref:NAD-dependent epimerase/dehydratase domain-containing protein n=1 Tax=Candidatus Woesebacteria bacterium RIFCSPLOWO2_01_FULL_44_14 TaxID=1802525 RepID=A0A1F8C2U8_9BACT|nr:MAG: hypothetical protein A2630_01965 [Candidatus Woesebacteria bacterium RIFCSPHIGHO2_01_FULL_44_10]OGM54590.1 MAG: hypothetical protein A3F62_03135 [Candidatus Woesebacteria bacterium RIFCSPHIGHO2_12_FULL_44_11]OGM70613.1 MAG: hypothetical protein A2975_00160 [Candidatus Woesebacteria bacterium RIFCSPLOWO2_01_FULL_44_14]
MILVTGIKGFIGSYVVAYLTKKGYNAVGINEDIRDIEALRPYFKDADLVIHAAGKVKKGIPNPEIYHTINVLGTKNVTDLCLEYGCKLIHLGSAATTAGGDITVRKYVESKQESQKIVEDYALHKGLKAVVLRLCVIYNKENNTGRSGARYPVERLVVDFENIIKTHDFKTYKLFDYSNVRA